METTSKSFTQLGRATDRFRGASLRRCLAAAFVAVLGVSGGSDRAIAFPEKPIRLMIPLPPGGAVDIVARLVQPHLDKALGKPFIIENRPGASGIIGANAVARSDPDGYTLLLAPTTFTINAGTRPNQPALRNLEPVALIARNSLLFLVNPQVKARNLKELEALARAQPDSISYATTGLASQAHLLFEQWSGIAGVQMKHVPYPGGPPAIHSTVAGETHVTLISPALSLSHVKSGALRVIATSGEKRDAELPDTPTAAESGYPSFSSQQWIGLFAPGSTPKSIIDLLNKEFQAALKRPDVITAMAKFGMTPGEGSAADFRRLVDQEIKMWAEIARNAKIKVE